MDSLYEEYFSYNEIEEKVNFDFFIRCINYIK